MAHEHPPRAARGVGRKEERAVRERTEWRPQPPARTRRCGWASLSSCLSCGCAPSPRGRFGYAIDFRVYRTLGIRWLCRKMVGTLFSFTKQVSQCDLSQTHPSLPLTCQQLSSIRSGCPQELGLHNNVPWY